MTKILYMEDIEGNYIKEFDAVVTKDEENYVCLDRTAFYPLGGGQPSDIGILKWNNGASEIKEVIKKGDKIKHLIDGEKPPLGTKIHGIINWEKRYNHMKMHTAQHIISGIVFDEYNARTVGNQIHTDLSRVDFYPVNFSEKDLENIEKNFNEIIKQNLVVNTYEEERESLEKRVDEQRCNLDLLPKFIKKLRIIEIKGFDICPCAGTHVRNTSEIPDIKIIKKESKGKERDRIIYSFQS
ncbi:MAG: alanyl-tRNA editing protein [Thermoplasmatales archaeon]|nr:MAG: alanyl-tRNA editing protein [Thermoplasmatales archaeon]